MAISRSKKEELLQELVNKFSRSNSVVFADYRGLDVAKLSELRGELRKQQAEMKVAKKTLLDLAAQKNDLGSIDPDFMSGPVAATFSYEDALAGVKVLFKFSKENEQLKLLGGVIDGKIVGPEVIAQYANLPSREELLAKLLGSMNAPLSGMVGIMNNLIAGFVRVVNAYKDTLPSAVEVAMAQPAQDTPAPATEVQAEVAVEEATEAPSEGVAETSEAQPPAEAV